MKRIAVILLSVLISFTFSPISFSKGIASSDFGITLGGGGSGSGGEEDDPEGQTSIPITCEYSESTSELVFYFLADLGNVTITVTNFLNGEVVTDTVNSQFGIVSFPISGDAGFYYISILTSSGATYHGQFAL